VKKALSSVAGVLRSLLGKQMKLRQVPALEFLVDTSEEYGRVMDRLLDSIKIEGNGEELPKGEEI
jgi:ribosome-binding factor A